MAFARKRLASLPETGVVGVSAIYQTGPVGFLDQPDFLNQVVALDTALPPLRLLDAVQAIETEAARVRTVRWGPRTLDVDIIWYEGTPVREERLEVPHPRLEERRFVLEPLADLAPGLVLPSGRTAREALEGVRDQVVTPYRSGKG